MHEKARRAELYLILRFESRRSRSLSYANGKIEQVSTRHQSGLGIQAFSRDGHSAFAALDRLDRRGALAKLGALAGACREAARRGHAANREIFRLEPFGCVIEPPVAYAHDALSLTRLQRELGRLHRELAAAHPGLKLQTSLQAQEQRWLVTRSDGTRAEFATPRCLLSNTFTRPGTEVLRASASLSRPSYEVLLDREQRRLLWRRSERAALLLGHLASAPHLDAGSYPLVLDYALAKGLAHEAVGHASESDSYRKSCLARGGRFRRGEQVADAGVSLIDEPIEGDHAYQPVSASGVLREPAHIVRSGLLEDGLGDVFTARRGGVRLTGAGRTESYRTLPLPRMSNIRIELERPVPLGGSFEDLEPEGVRDLLRSQGLLGRGPVAWLRGYRGGQVNSKRGDFVFNCSAIYLLGPRSIKLYRPAIFSGFFLSALAAIRAGFGPLALDAIGTCGKWGQRVPSSGGSHWLLFLERRADLLLGGRVA